MNLSEENVLSGLRENYDGFCFDSKGQTHVYCPWSVLNFLTSPHLGFANYWFRSGGQPAVLMRYLDGHELADSASYGADLLFPLSALDASAGYDDLKAEVLLTQAGYLTVKHACDDGFVQLGYPNKEVSRSMAELYASQLLKNRLLLRAGSTPISALSNPGRGLMPRLSAGAAARCGHAVSSRSAFLLGQVRHAGEYRQTQMGVRVQIHRSQCGCGGLSRSGKSPDDFPPLRRSGSPEGTEQNCVGFLWRGKTIRPLVSCLMQVARKRPR